MYIRQAKTGTSSDGTVHYSFRLVESVRNGAQVRQLTLLNLGRYFSIEREYWPLLCQRIEELRSGQVPIGYGEIDPTLEAEAHRIANLLNQRQGQAVPERVSVESGPDWQTVDLNSVQDHDVRSIGGEYAALQAVQELGLPERLLELGFNPRQQRVALGLIIARMIAPASDRQTHHWLSNISATGELLGQDFGALSEMTLHRVSDKLLDHQQGIEEQVFERACSLFQLQPTLAFYDLTNTYFEGSAEQIPEAQFGRSKEKRSDCRLLTLGLVVDASGFVMKSRMFAGNVAEVQTLETMMGQLGGKPGAVVVMDRGIASASNLAWLREQGYQYVVVSREQTREFDFEHAQLETLTNRANREVQYYQELVEHQENGETWQESYVRCYSEARADKEQSLLRHHQKNYEEQLTQLNQSLGKPKARNTIAVIQQRLGRLHKSHSRVARHYQLNLITTDDDTRVSRVDWQFDPKSGTMMTHPGVYALRSNILNWDGETLWRIDHTLTEVESVFRALKSELGMRPVYHQTTERCCSHLLIAVLAYQAVCVLRTRMKAQGHHDSWGMIRETLSTICRTTTTFQRRDGRTLHLRKTAMPDAIQSTFYQAMGLKTPPRRLQKTVV